MNLLLLIGICAVGGLIALLIGIWAIGVIMINDHEVGIVTKKFSSRNLPNGNIIALNGEAGVQADVLSTGWHFFFWPWQYSIEKVDFVQVPEGEIALVIANDGSQISDSRILGDRVDCNNFQDARAFLTNGGKKGRQSGKITTGLYRINTRLFTVITSSNSKQFDISPDALTVLTIDAENVGIVTIHDGKSLIEGEIAAPITANHASFQDEQAFITNGGFRGLQQEVVLPGTWNLNPWFATVEIVKMLEIPKAHVGVVISYVGPQGQDVSGVDFKYGDIVENGKKGIWAKPLNPGLYPINPRTTHVELVPTSNFVLNWSSETGDHKLDEGLTAVRMRSKDGFEITLEVQQIIHVPYEVAPKLIARFGNMLNLVQNVLEPLVGNYFRNAGQDCTVLDFVNSRTLRQQEAKEYVSIQLRQFNVEGVETMIGHLVVPEALMKTLQDRKIAEESSATVQMQRDLAQQRQQLERENAIADQQRELVTSEQRVKIASQNADAAKREAEGQANVARAAAEGAADALKTRSTAEAAALKITRTAEGEANLAQATNDASAIERLADANASKILKEGEAEAQVIEKKTNAIGKESYAAIEIASRLSNGKIKLTPDIMLGGNGEGGLTSLMLLKSLGINLPIHAETPTTGV